MINTPMNTVRDLDYLAEHMEEWPEGADFVYVGPGNIIRNVEGGDPRSVNYISREQWAAARLLRGLYHSSMAERYPKYYKDVRHLDYIDVYRIHQLYQIDDPSGCLQHADKKILLSGERTGGKPKRKDIEEARDTLTRWLEIQDEDEW